MPDNLAVLVSTLLHGLPATVAATLGGIGLTIVLSFAAGLALLSPLRGLRVISRGYVEGFRGTSEVVQLFFIYFSLPLLIGFQLVPLWAGVLVLGLNHGAYGAEIVRGAVQSVPRAQYEGAVALSLTPAQRMRRVILPQAVLEMIPPFNNLFIQLLKSSSLLSLITLAELTWQAQDVLVPLYTHQAFTIFSLVLVLYLLLALTITGVMRLLERRAGRMLGRRRPARSRTDALVSTVGVG
ncbi:MAG TPA: ectoine/hydroxyectoine ABC transporter permease subunit EhuC [Pseudonocardiaceae bacterium]|jgi:polar amino acid transport system permease protein|nr:ectoine/hydroxyectoine ABC transporter permease subunit EhuC [Pseudonocardiaceae bacterium]